MKYKFLNIKNKSFFYVINVFVVNDESVKNATTPERRRVPIYCQKLYNIWPTYFVEVEFAHLLQSCDHNEIFFIFNVLSE